MCLENIVLSLLAPLQNAVIFVAVLWILPVIWQRQLLCLGRRKQWHRYSIFRCNIGMIIMGGGRGGGDARVMYWLGMYWDCLYILSLILNMFCSYLINGIFSGCLVICNWLSVWRMIPWINRISQGYLGILNKNITNVYRIDTKKNNWNIFIRPFAKRTYYAVAMSVRLSVRPPVWVFRTFFQHALRYQFDTWNRHLVGGTTCRVWVSSQLGHFDLVYSKK